MPIFFLDGLIFVLGLFLSQLCHCEILLVDLYSSLYDKNLPSYGKTQQGVYFSSQEKSVPCQSCFLIEMSYFLATISLLALFLAYIVIFSQAKAPLLFVPIFRSFRTPSSWVYIDVLFIGWTRNPKCKGNPCSLHVLLLLLLLLLLVVVNYLPMLLL